MEEVLQLRFMAVLSLAVGCASPAGEAKVRPAAEPRVAKVMASAVNAKEPNTAVLGVLRFRDADLVVHASSSVGGGVRFAVSARGQLAARVVLTESELDHWYPELHEEYRDAVASGRLVLDARLDPRFVAQPDTPRTWRSEHQR